MNPWQTIWFHPIETLKSLANTKVNRGFVFFCFVSGFVSLFNVVGYHIRPQSFIILFAVNVLLAFPFGYVALNIEAGIIYLFTRIFKSKREQKNQFKRVRACVAWSWYPRLVLFIIIMLSSSILFLYAPSGQVETMNQIYQFSPAFVWVMGILMVISGIWSLVILIGGISGVLHISGLKAFAAFILSMILIIAVLAVLMTLLNKQPDANQTAILLSLGGNI